MERRDFLSSSSVALLTSLMADVPSFADVGATPKADAAPKLFRLTEKNDPASAEKVYRGLIGKGGLQASDVPYVYAYYDEALKKFVNPLDLKPALKAQSYTLEASLHAFNIRKSEQSKFSKLKNQVQLGFNVGAATTKSDQLTWVFMNAIDVFLAKKGTESAQLTKFSKDQGGVPLKANPKVTVPNGTISLQVTAFGQRPDGFWKTFFDFLTKASSSPIASTALKGFGIPSLATDALGFVDHALDVFAQQNKLVDLWKTGSLDFAIADGATGRFGMKKGLWVTVDSDYAQSSNFLEGHSVDLTYQSFRITDQKKVPVDANYLVAEILIS
jgi:hypothetical protein